MQFLFEERDARDLAAMRIALGLVLLVWWVELTPDLTFWFSDRGPVDTELLDTNWSIYRSHFLDGLGDRQLRLVHLVGLVAILAYTVGFATPLMNAVILFLLAAYWHRSPWIQNGGDRLLRIFVFYMLFADSGRAWSVDSRLRGLRDATASVFAIRLVQFQLIVMYTYTGIAKLSGHTWIDGTAIYYSLSDIGYARWPELLDALLPNVVVQGVSRLLTWATLFWEVFYAPLVIWKKTRAATLLAGVALHIGIFGLLAVGIFSWSTLWGYLAFLPSGWAGRLADRVRARVR